MAHQRSITHLRRSRFYRSLLDFQDDPGQDTLTFSKDVNSTEREDIRQICKHLELSFKCNGQGSQKYMVVIKPNYVDPKLPNFSKEVVAMAADKKRLIIVCDDPDSALKLGNFLATVRD